MRRQYRVATPDEPEQWAPFTEIAAMAFGTTETKEAASLQQAGVANIRLVHEGEALVGGLEIIPMGQWFGGRSVPTAGIASVAVAPHFRGRGAARALMEDVLREQRAGGCALSTLYPATVTLYRRCGYELAGGRYTVRLSPRLIGPISRDCEISRVNGDDQQATEQLYASWAAARNGYLDREARLWNRIRRPHATRAHGFLFSYAGRPKGYVYYVQRTPSTHEQQIDATDLVATSPRAAASILAFLADHRSLVTEALWHTGPADPLLMLLPERHYRVELETYWMLRIVHLPHALEARGYPPNVSAELRLDVQDELLAENAGRWRVTIRNGRAEVGRGGEGSIQCDIRALAALYSGFQSAEGMALTSRFRCSPQDAAIVNAVFAGAPPAMADVF
jgi:predicted acetyltransferase